MNVVAPRNMSRSMIRGGDATITSEADWGTVTSMTSDTADLASARGVPRSLSIALTIEMPVPPCAYHFDI